MMSEDREITVIVHEDENGGDCKVSINQGDNVIILYTVNKENSYLLAHTVTKAFEHYGGVIVDRYDTTKIK